MQIIKNIIEQKNNLYEEFMLKRDYLRAFSHFYSCFNLALAILGKRLDKKEYLKRKKLWKRLVMESKVNKKNLIKIQIYLERDMKEIVKAQQIMDEEIDSSDYYKSKLEEKGAIMVVGWAYPEK